MAAAPARGRLVLIGAAVLHWTGWLLLVFVDGSDLADPKRYPPTPAGTEPSALTNFRYCWLGSLPIQE